MAKQQLIRKGISASRRSILALGVAALANISLPLTSIGFAEEQKQVPITITDELGRELTIQSPVKAVHPDLWYQSEIVRAIGAKDTIVSIDQSSNPNKNPANKVYFAEFADFTDVGHYNQPNWEAIAASGAELFFARRNSPWQDAVEKLTPFGIQVYVASTWDPKVLRAQLPNIGKIFGKEEGAAKLATLFDEIDTILKDRLKDVQPKNVFFENNAEYVTSLPGSGWHDTIELGGGKNIFSDVIIENKGSATVHTYTVDPVEIINRNPDVIIHNGIDGKVSGYQPWDKADQQAQAARVLSRPGWESIKAVEDKNVYVINNFFFSSLGKQIGALAVAKWLHPDLFADINLDDYFGRWLEAQGVEQRPASDYFYKVTASQG